LATESIFFGRIKDVSTISRFYSLQEFVHQDKIISGEKFLNRSLTDQSFNYLKRDFLYKSGVWRQHKVKSWISRSNFYASKTLVMGHSDISTKKTDALILKKLGVLKVYAVNNYPLKRFSESLPLGITNCCDDSPIHRLLGNESHFLKANSTEFGNEYFTPSIYVNFTSGNNSGVRNKLLSLAGEISSLYKVTIQTPDFTDNGRVKYLENLRSKGLVLCPEGNGVDTHRFWETLYMGGIPVVTKNPMMQSFYDRLPVLQLNSWKDLSDISLVESKWWKLTERTYDFEILSADYWIGRFSSKRKFDE
jgi:hypothetical protein